MTRLKCVGNLACIGGGGGGDVDEGEGGEGEGGEGEGGKGEGGEGDGDEGEGGEGVGGEGEDGEGVGGEGEGVEGEGGEVEDGEGEGGEGEGGEGEGGEPNVMLNVSSSPGSRSFSGVQSSLDADSRVAAVPLFLARTAALLLARVAVSAVLAFFKASGRAL